MKTTIRRGLLDDRLERFTRTLQRVDRDDTDAVHAARVLSRRLRELLPVLQLGPDASRKLATRLKKTSRHLAKVRDLDVALGLLADLGEPDRAVRSAITYVQNELRQHREQKRIVAQTAKATADGRRAIRRLEAAREGLASGETAVNARAMQWAVRALVARRATTLKRAIGVAGAVYLPERLHTVRIAIKKLRYGAEIAAEATGSVAPADLRVLERQQDLLGRMHDLQALVDHVRALQGSLTPPDLKAWQELGALVLLLEKRCRRLHARYVRMRPAVLAVCDRLGMRAAPAQQRKANTARRVS